jgi:hypothetical protein
MKGADVHSKPLFNRDGKLEGVQIEWENPFASAREDHGGYSVTALDFRVSFPPDGRLYQRELLYDEAKNETKEFDVKTNKVVDRTQGQPTKLMMRIDPGKGNHKISVAARLSGTTGDWGEVNAGGSSERAPVPSTPASKKKMMSRAKKRSVPKEAAMTVGNAPPKLPSDPFEDLMMQGVEVRPCIIARERRIPESVRLVCT